jgi:hypothetical protein
MKGFLAAVTLLATALNGQGTAKFAPDLPTKLICSRRGAHRQQEGIRPLSANCQVRGVEILAPVQARAHPDKTGYVRWTIDIEFLQ